MPKLTVSDASYSSLLKSIKQEIAGALDRARAAYEREKITAYWNIGAAIAKHLAANSNKKNYGKHLYQKLSEDLGIGERLLYQISQFYDTYPNFKPLPSLNWSHYRLLVTVKDKKQRIILETKASNDNLSPRALENFLKADEVRGGEPEPGPSSKVLSIVKGQFYTYLLFKAAYAENILVDCGFSVYWESDLAQYAGNYAQILKTETGYQFTKISPDEKKLYTYKACVKKIVDGDTIWLDIDCGFKIWANQKIRLRGINAPEITTPKGRQAYKYVCNALNGLPFVVIKSHGRDKYDRYLIDIFYLKGETDPQVVLEKGNFLNQELLDHGLAVRQD